MAMCGDGGILLLGSSVYRKKGYMYRKYKQLHGNNDGEDICWFAPSATMNPILPMQFVEKALAEDLAKAGAEFLNRWREDLVDFIPVDVVEGCTDFNVHERSPRRDVNYCAYCDPAGGTGTDSFTIAIAHREHDENATVRLDLIRERKPRFAPAAVIRSTLNYCANTGLAWSKVTSSQAVFTLMSGNGTASRSHPARRRPPKTTCMRCRCC